MTSLLPAAFWAQQFFHLSQKQVFIHFLQTNKRTLDVLFLSSKIFPKTPSNNSIKNKTLFVVIQGILT